MADEIDFENGRISNFQRHVTLTLDRAIWYTVVYHSSTSTYKPNFIWIEETLWMDVQTRRSRPKGKGKGRILAIALLIWVRLVTRSTLQSRKWQLIGTS